MSLFSILQLRKTVCKSHAFVVVLVIALARWISTCVCLFSDFSFFHLSKTLIDTIIFCKLKIEEKNQQKHVIVKRPGNMNTS